MENIHVALAFDDNYLEHSIVLMTSILANKNDNEKIFFHIIDGGLNDRSKEILWNMKNCVINFYTVDKSVFEHYKKSDYYPISMLYTMILPDVINVDKLIYLDSDMVVNSSLTELWQINLEDNFVAAIEDANGKKYAKRFGLKIDSKFFNSGVMLINCKKWLENDIPHRAAKISMEKTGTTFGFDQTVLNQLFEDKVKFLDLKWNLQYCPINVWPTYENIDEYKKAILNPNIIHYVGDYKPWKQGLGCFNPKQENYFRYHKLTCFAFSDYKKWHLEDKSKSYKGILALIKRYPLFFLRKQFWKNLRYTSLLKNPH